MRTKRKLKVCASCKHAFQPQITSSDILPLIHVGHEEEADVDLWDIPDSMSEFMMLEGPHGVVKRMEQSICEPCMNAGPKELRERRRRKRL